MSDDWIDLNIALLRNNQDIVLRSLGNTLANNRNLITKSVTAVDKTTKELVIIKLGNYN